MSPSSRPLYFRLLRVRYLRPRSLTAFVLFEGSIVLGVLLALADIVNWWGVLAVPVAVAAMVKVHDSVAAALARPELRTEPRLESRLESRATPRDGVAIGVAPVPSPYPGPPALEGPRPRPRPGIRRPESPVPALDVDGAETPGEGRPRGNQGHFGG